MFWMFILITALGFMLVKLGALSVMVKALLALLCLALLVIAGVGGSVALAKGIRGQWIEIICRLAPRTTMTGTWCEFVTIDAPDQ